MKHAEETSLALWAGGELGPLDRWLVGRHLTRCAACRGEVEAFGGARVEAASLNALPEIRWDRLGPEMKANIRLGLSAGECVGPRTPLEQQRPLVTLRSVVAWASVAAVLVAGIWIQDPGPARGSREMSGMTGVVLEATPTGIELSEGGQRLILMHPRGSQGTLSFGAQGVMRAGYVDADSGHVTIHHVYAQ
ncbi:MAG: hypothetical protein FJW37_00860 [Acidobacteria bacterium]|nr:hypothetical protein [Acidobacteriota bacterium]